MCVILRFVPFWHSWSAPSTGGCIIIYIYFNLSLNILKQPVHSFIIMENSTTPANVTLCNETNHIV